VGASPPQYAGVTLGTSPDGMTVAFIEPGLVSLGQINPSRVARSLDGGAAWKDLPTFAVSTTSVNPTPLGFATGALQGSDYAITNDGKFWFMPKTSDDYTQDGYYQVAGIYYVDQVNDTTIVHLVKSEPGALFLAEAFFAVNQTPSGFVCWSDFTANGLGFVATGIYHYAL
jgi:hypothetical protein